MDNPIEDMQSIIDYVYPDEAEHYKRTEDSEKADHIFLLRMTQN